MIDLKSFVPRCSVYQGEGGEWRGPWSDGSREWRFSPVIRVSDPRRLRRRGLTFLEISTIDRPLAESSTKVTCGILCPASDAKHGVADTVHGDQGSHVRRSDVSLVVVVILYDT